MLSDKLLEYIEKTRGCIHTLEQQGTSVSRSESLSPSTVSGASPSSISVATASSPEKMSPDGSSLFSQWDKMDMEVPFVSFEITYFSVSMLETCSMLKL